MIDIICREGYGSCKVCSRCLNYEEVEENLGPTKCQQLR